MRGGEISGKAFQSPEPLQVLRRQERKPFSHFFCVWIKCPCHLPARTGWMGTALLRPGKRCWQPANLHFPSVCRESVVARVPTTCETPTSGKNLFQEPLTYKLLWVLWGRRCGESPGQSAVKPSVSLVWPLPVPLPLWPAVWWYYFRHEQ